MEIQRIPLEGAKNIRDLGGFPTKDGRVIKPHRLLRGCELYVTTENDREVLLNEYELKTVLDFRTTKEKGEHPDPELTGVVNHHMPVLDEQALGVTREGQDGGDFMIQVASYLKSPQFDATVYMSAIYENIIRGENAQKQYGRMFDILLSQEEGAILWHCTAGKDRAGIASILVLTALGVKDDVIRQDYFMVNEFLKEVNDMLCKNVTKRLGDDGIYDGLMAMFTVHPSYLERMYKTIETYYGSMDQYLEKILGLTPEKKERLKALYLE